MTSSFFLRARCETCICSGSFLNQYCFHLSAPLQSRSTVVSETESFGERFPVAMSDSRRQAVNRVLGDGEEKHMNDGSRKWLMRELVE